MKKIILLIAIIPFLFSSCDLLDFPDVNELQKQVEQLQKDVAELQKVNGITPNHQSTESKSKNDEVAVSNNNKSGLSNEQQAVEAIKYCLKMYKPSLKYKNIRGVEKPNGTVDVIIDYIFCGTQENTYYNVNLYNDGTFKINDIRGVEGNFPHNEKFTMK